MKTEIEVAELWYHFKDVNTFSGRTITQLCLDLANLHSWNLQDSIPEIEETIASDKEKTLAERKKRDEEKEAASRSRFIKRHGHAPENDMEACHICIQNFLRNNRYNI